MSFYNHQTFYYVEYNIHLFLGLCNVLWNRHFSWRIVGFPYSWIFIFTNKFTTFYRNTMCSETKKSYPHTQTNKI